MYAMRVRASVGVCMCACQVEYLGERVCEYSLS